MLLDVSRLRGGVEHLDRRFEAGAFDASPADFRIVEPAHLVADATKDGRKVRLVGRLTGALECECSRCLEPYRVPVGVDLDLLFLPQPEATGTGTGDEEVAENDLGVSYYKNDVLDLMEMMREQFYLALPMKPLCREDCQGLCPVCGTNRNRETCACQPTWVDPRLAVLEKLKEGR